MSGEKYKYYSSSSNPLLRPSLYTPMSQSALCSRTPSTCVLPIMRQTKFHTRIKQQQVIIVCIYGFVFWVAKWKTDCSGTNGSRHSGTDGGRHSGTDGGSHSGTDGSRHSGTGGSRHSGTDGSSHSGTDGGSHSGTDGSRHSGTGGSRHSGTGGSRHSGTDGGRLSGTDGGRHSLSSSHTPRSLQPAAPSQDVSPTVMSSFCPASCALTWTHTQFSLHLLLDSSPY
jgi:hypothetical protein